MTPGQMISSMPAGSAACRRAIAVLAGVPRNAQVVRRPPPCIDQLGRAAIRHRWSVREQVDRRTQVERAVCLACASERRVLRGTYIYVAPRHHHQRGR